MNKDMIEAGAKKIAHHTTCVCRSGTPCFVCQEAAIAAFTAMVGAMGDGEAYDIRPIWNPWNADQFYPDDVRHAAQAERNRTALLEAPTGDPT